MASSEDDVVVRLRLKDVKAFIADVKSGRLAIEDLEKQVKKTGDTAGKVTAQGTGGLSKLVSHFGFLAGWARTGALALGAATVGVAGYAVKSAASMEQVGVSMETMLGSASKAKAMMADLQKFAVATPFEFGDVAKQAQHLLAFGFAAKTVIPTLTAVGNAASGLSLGPEGLDRIVTALGQMQMKGRVQGDEMLQLAEAGINANAYLEKAFHLTPQQLQKAQQAGKISAAAAIPVILKGMDDQFHGLMEKQSHTLSGIWSNFHDALQQNLVKAINPFLPALEGWMQKAVDALPGIMTRLQGVLTTVTSRVHTFVSRAMDVIPYLRTGDDYGAANIIARLFGDSDGKTAPTIEHLIGLVRNVASVLTDVVWPAVRDTATAFGTILGGALTVAIPALEGVLGFVEDHKDTFRNLAAAILAAAAAYKVVKIATELWTGAQVLLDAALDANPIGIAILAIAELVGQFVFLYRQSKPFHDFVDSLWAELQRMYDWISTNWAGISALLALPFQAAANAIQHIIDAIVTSWNNTIGRLPGNHTIDVTGTGGDSSSGWSVGHVGGTGAEGIGKLLGHHVANQADGGTTVRPGLSWVGERGPELLNMPRGAQVIPLPRGGAGQPIHVHVEVNGREIATAVLDDLNARAARR